MNQSHDCPAIIEHRLSISILGGSSVLNLQSSYFIFVSIIF